MEIEVSENGDQITLEKWVSENALLSSISKSAGGAAGALGSGRAPKPRPSPEDPRTLYAQNIIMLPSVIANHYK